jgi:hypothetical protein
MDRWIAEQVEQPQPDTGRPVPAATGARRLFGLGPRRRPADDRRPNQARGSMLARHVVTVMTPTNHRTAHPGSTASVTTTPRFMGTQGGVRHPFGNTGPELL